MHDAAFARAAVQPPVRLLRLLLKPYAIGHELILLNSQLRLPTPKPTQILTPTGWDRVRLYRAVLEGVVICSQSWAENQRPGAWGTLKTWLWCRWVWKQDLDAAIDLFREYREAGSSWPPSQPPSDAAGRTPGSPFLLRLHRFIMQDAQISEVEAWDYSLGLAQWRWSAYWEAQGRMEVLNEGETDFLAWCEEQDAAATSNPKAGGARA